MSLKDLFGKTTNSIVSNKQIQELYDEVESHNYLEKVAEDRQRFLPAVDFTTASNFAKYGSAQKYYVDGINNIYQNYPYDGSKSEKQDWRNKSSQIDLYIFDNIYPKTTGYVNLGSGSAIPYLSGTNIYRDSNLPQFVKINGGPNKSPTGKFDTSNIYDLSKNRESNLGITQYGNTVEFWFKDNENTLLAANSVFCLFDLWNNQSSGSSNYTRLTIEHSSSNTFLLTYVSGTKGVVKYPLTCTTDLTNWHHYAFAFNNNSLTSSNLDINFYVDGQLYSSNTLTNYGDISLANNSGSIAYIGAYQANSSGGDVATWDGLGNSFGSFDEFRFWKTARNSKQIYRNYFTNLGGGSNTDNSNTNIGVYLKFNEGFIDSSSINTLDALCLDYSGRVSNGTILNYDLNVKSTGSAINTFFNDLLEEKDPIIFSSNPLVISTLDTYSQLGYKHDYENISSIYNTIPSWITEEAEDGKINDLSNLTQIISSYFDTLHLQIESLINLKNVNYYKEGDKPPPFANKLLSSYGFENLEIFNDITFLEDVLSRNENTEYEEKIHNIKNLIYQNIYNNLVYIYKSKGTEKALRNLIRCFGIDNELLKINLYSNNSVYELNNKYEYVSSPKKFVDFNNPDRYSATIYQRNISGDSDTRGYLTGSNTGYLSYVPLTSQIEIIFPKKITFDFSNYNLPEFTEVSLFGAHTAKTNPVDLRWGIDTLNYDLFNFQVYAIKRAYDSPDVYFKLVTTINGVTSSLTTDWYKDVYDNQKWNFAIRVAPEKYEFANFSSGSTKGSYLLEFIGHNTILDSIENSFILSSSISEINAKAALSVNKRFYTGAHYLNTTSSILTRTDVKVSSLRVWYDYLTNEELKAHSFDSTNVGRQYPNWKPYYITGSLPITRLDTLALNWDFFNVTSSDSNGQFVVQDASSGSLEASLAYGLGLLGSITKYRHTGYGYNFSTSDQQVVNKEYIFNAKQQQPETINGSDLVQVPDTDDYARPKTIKPLNFYLSIEKSMAQIINDEILNWFATIKDFNNLIGEPIERYRHEYKNLSHLRKIFFDKVGNTPDYEKFLNYYKWIDSSISMMLSQLVPASANISNMTRNMVESHLLERNKIQSKAPSLDFNGEIVSVANSSLFYSYDSQTAPNNPTGSMWLKQRAERTGPLVNTPLEPQNDIDREIIRQVINSKHLNKTPTLYSVDYNTSYEGKKDLSRFFSQTYKLTVENLTSVEDIITTSRISNNLVSSSFVFSFNSLTSSGQIVQPIKKYGNYFNNYEYLQLVGRSTNNKSFVDLTGTIDSSTSSSGLGFTDRTLPIRNTYNTVFVERFSAPGGPETLSRGALDGASEEYSVYNELNSRNLKARKQLRTWLAETSSYDSNNPSYHKVNKNPGYVRANSTSSNIEAQYDNAFIQHQIPRSDVQYSWITASVSTKPNASGYFTDFTNLTIYNTSSIVFISGAISGAFIVDFLGLNTTINKDINLSTNTISTGSGYNNDLNKYLHNINGTYGYPSWKQIRKQNNKIVQDSIKNNKIIVQDPPKQLTRTNSSGYYENYTDKRTLTFKTYKQPAVTFNKPLKHSLFVSGSVDPVNVISTYDNNKERFSNEELTKVLGVQQRQDKQLHDILVSKDIGEYQPRPEILTMSYEQVLYPSDNYATLSDVRIRDNYEDYVENTASVVNTKTFWRDEISERGRANSSADLFNILETQANNLPTTFTSSMYNTNFTLTINQNNTFKESIFSQDNYRIISHSFGNSSNIFSKYIAGYNNLQYDSTLAGLQLNGTVYSIVSSSNGLFAAGNFYNIYGSESISTIARWDGNRWNNLGTGSTSNSAPITSSDTATVTIYSLLSSSEGLYAGGDFTDAGGSSSADYIARWNGDRWFNVGTGTVAGSPAFYVGTIYAMASGSEGLYVGGYFFDAGGTGSADYIARWNGSRWFNVGTGSAAGSAPLNQLVYALESGSDGLYVGGSFTTASNGSPSNYIARWNGQQWSSLGSTSSLNSLVYSIKSGSDGLYAGGAFTNVNGTASADYIAKWDGINWSSISGSLNGIVYTIISNSSGLTIGGAFTNVNGTASADYIAKWNGVDWSAVPELQVNNTVRTIISGTSNFYIGGQFTAITTSYNKSANIINYTSSVQGNIYKDDLIKQKYFISSLLEYPLGSIAVYDIEQENIYNISKNFNNTNNNLNNYIYSLFSGSDGVYIGGNFVSASNNTATSHIAKWNGSSLSNLGTGSVAGSTPIGYDNYGNSLIKTILSSSEGVYAGGKFENAGGSSSADYIARWNGDRWFNVGTGTFGPSIDTSAWGSSTIVNSITSGSDGLYIGGQFYMYAANGNGTTSLAKWDGRNWSRITVSAFSNILNVILSGTDGLYAGGTFSSAGGLTAASYIAKWNGTSWTNLGSGSFGQSPLQGQINSTYGVVPYSFLSNSNGLYVGGGFTKVANNTGSSGIALWNGSSWSNLGPGLNGPVFSIVSNSSGLYAGGKFSYTANGTTNLNNIAKWDGTEWTHLGSDGDRNGVNTTISDAVYAINNYDTILSETTGNIIFAGFFPKTKSTPIVKDRRTEKYIPVYFNASASYMPSPKLIYTNFISPSSGSNNGAIVYETTYDSNNKLTSVNKYTKNEKIHIINQGYIYEVDKKSNKKPFFNSYLEYLNDIKYKTQNYSIVPEYRISELMEIYIKERNGDFRTLLKRDYLKLEGGLQEYGFEDINSSINTTNNLNTDIIFNVNKNFNDIDLNIKVSGIKKLIPYRGFYPSERILKLSNYFINSFIDTQTVITSAFNTEETYKSYLSNGTPLNQQVLTLIQPLFAPGILLNTIKSSIAVDFPVIITSSVTYDSTILPNFYANTGSQLINNKSNDPLFLGDYNYTSSNYINVEPNFRLPFEALLEFDSRIPDSLKSNSNNLYYLNPTHYTSDLLVGSDYKNLSYPSYNMGTGSLNSSFSFKDPNYKLAMHNFLAEIPNFFLNGKLSNIVSSPQSRFKAATKNVRYYMDVILERSEGLSEFITDPYLENLRLNDKSHINGTLLLPSTDSLYGPPVRYWNNANPELFLRRGPYFFYSKILNTPAFAPYVPPYYYGKSIARLSFLASASRQFSLAEILDQLEVEYINTEAEQKFRKYSNFINGVFTNFIDNYSSSPAYRQLMPISSSINLKLVSDAKQATFNALNGQPISISKPVNLDPTWVIQTKFETPSLNFVNSDLSDNIGLKFVNGDKNTLSTVNGVYEYMFKGMWTTYGTPVENNKGIKMYLQESPKGNSLTGSLISLCGFENSLDKKTVGLLRNKKKVYEGLVIIPYTYTKNHGNNIKDEFAETLPEILGENGNYGIGNNNFGNGPYYYKIDRNILTKLLGISFDRTSKATLEQIKSSAEASELKDNSLVKMVLSMTRYVLPPHLDWLTNKEIDPFIMYLAEFSTTFDRDDLSDIWQGVMPKSAYTAELEEISLKHSFEKNEAFHSKRPLPNTKFKIFKIKEKANINYYKLSSDSSDDTRFTFKFANSSDDYVPQYSYNWPYDFFSLTELVNVEASLNLKKKI